MIAQLAESFWMPTQASSYAGRVDWVFYFILSIATFFFALILVLMVLFVVRYRRRDGHLPEKTSSHSTTLELTWTIIPTILVVIIFVLGFKGFMDIATVPSNTYEIMVTAAKWSWAFTYPNGHVDSNLHVPVNQPVRLTLMSQDVIHSLYIPAFRVKKDAVPGRFNQMWFQPTQVNDTDGYELFCAEYCGTKHSEMLARVYVHEPTAFKRWLDEASNWEGRMTPAERGAQLYKQRGCFQCHSIDGSLVIGPTFKDLWDHVVEGNVTFRDGSRLADLLGPNYSPAEYIRESIYEPDAKHVAGYTPAMQSYKGQIKENEIPAIISFLGTLSTKHKPEVATQPATGTADTTTAPAGSTSTQPAPATQAVPPANERLP